MLAKLFKLEFFIPLIITLTFASAIIGALVFKPKEYSKSRLSLFMTILASGAVVIIALQVIVAALTLVSEDEKKARALYKDGVTEGYLKIYSLLAKSRIRPEFFASFHYNNPRIYQALGRITTENNHSFIANEYFILQSIMQSLEDYLYSLSCNDSQGFFSFYLEEWLAIFLIWSHSPYFQENLPYLKVEFTDKTIEFAELLVEKAKTIPLPPTNPEIYKEEAKKLAADPKLQNFIKDLKAVKDHFYK